MVHKMNTITKKVSKEVSDLSPDENCRIREKLRLSQVEAGGLLGGGPRAFTKYENGAIKPAASREHLAGTRRQSWRARHAHWGESD